MKRSVIVFTLLTLILIISCKKKIEGDKWGSPISKSEWVQRGVNSDNSLEVEKFGSGAKDKEAMRKYYECFWDKTTEYLDRNFKESDIVEKINYRKDSIPDLIYGEIVMSCGSQFLQKNTVQEQRKEVERYLSNTTPGLYPELSERKITESELTGTSKHDLRIMRNEIFARHGYIFVSEDLREYFGKQEWYKPRYNNVENLLTEDEKYNIQLIKKLEH